MPPVNLRRVWLIGMVAAAVVVVALLWWAFRSDGGSVSIRFAGTTNYNEQTFVLFAITNRMATNIRGAAFQINFTDGHWVEAIRPKGYATTPGLRDIWLAPAGSADSGTVLGIIPTSSNTWRMVFGIQQGGIRVGQTSWRNRLFIYLHQHGYHHLAQRVSVSADRGWTQKNYPGESVLGPKMRGTQVK